LGTVAAFNKIDFTQLDLIVIGLADQFLNIIEYKAREKAFHLFNHLIYNLNIKKAPVIIQAFQPQNVVLKALSQQRPELFYQKERRLRRRFDFPPYVELIKLIYQKKSYLPTLGEAFSLYAQLKNKFKDKPEIEILKPLPQRPLRRKKLTRVAILIKIKKENVWPELVPFLNKLNDSWLIDREVENIIE
jgi:primosomal protein N' (replication factor Y)